MKERINIAELLKECRVRTWLYCPMFGSCLLSAVSTDENSIYPIKIVSPNHNSIIHFTIDGICFWMENSDGNFDISCSECLLFPSSDYRSWEGVKVENGKLVIPEVKSQPKYYCYGSKKRCKEIRVAFEKHGAKNAKNFAYDCNGTLYYINNIGYVQGIVKDEQDEQELISQGYKEIELPSSLIPDKAFVEAWDDDSFHRAIGFYDRKNDALFTDDGKRGGEYFDNYQVVDEPEWAKKIRTKLEE